MSAQFASSTLPMAELCRPRHRSDNEPTIFAPSPYVNPRLHEPSYQRYERGHARFFSVEQKAIALERQGYVCPICYGSIGMEGQCHHMVRWDLGGSSSLDNMVVVHAGDCHKMADARGLANNDLIIGGTVFDAEPSQKR